jgi:Methyltransferase domain
MTLSDTRDVTEKSEAVMDTPSENPVPGFFDCLRGLPGYRPAMVQRLNLRHRFVVQPFEAEIRGSRVLDLGAHDGRWAYAFAASGADTVIGYEARQNLVNRYRRFPETSFKHRVRLEVDDIFEALERLGRAAEQFDVVAVLGIFYHIMEHYRLLRLIHRLRPRLVLIDSVFMVANRPYIAIRLDNPVKNRSAFAFDRQKKMPVGVPSRLALERMADSLEYSLEWLDWKTVPQTDRHAIKDYFEPRHFSQRFTCMLRPRP